MILATLALALAQPCTVSDGDTLRCLGGKLRLEAIDTPEKRGSPACATKAKARRHWCGDWQRADRATLAMRRWLNRGPYVLVLTWRCDRYGRALGTVRRGREDVRQVLVAGGFARVDRTNYREWRCGA